MQLSQLAEGEADSETSFRLRFLVVDLREHVERALQGGRLKADAIVDYAYFDLASILDLLQLDIALSRRAFDRIVEQIRDHLCDPRGISQHHERAVEARGLKVLASRFHERRTGFDRQAQRFANVEPHKT